MGDGLEPRRVKTPCVAPGAAGIPAQADLSSKGCWTVNIFVRDAGKCVDVITRSALVREHLRLA